MSDQPLDRDASQYVRPTQDWICGRASEGHPCRIGPDSRGRCRATCECTPALDIKPGESKGRYRCTRPAEAGGPCENGPLPDGTCCRAIPRCQPVRTLRSKRKVFTWAVISATIAFLLLALYGDNRWQFINPGNLSSQHSGSGFVQAYLRLHPGAVHGDPGCAGCHTTAQAGPSGWLRSAAHANPSPLRTHELALMTTAQMTGIDKSCQACHAARTFHEPNVLEDRSCSACHKEHLGSGPMRRPDDANCISCHGSASVMQSSLEKGKTLPAAAFNFRPDNGRQVFHAPRPEQGHTGVIHSFATDHPEFQVIADKLKDPDSLKFNHELHLTSSTVPQIDGRRLQCADCHKPDAAGIFYQRVSFEDNCRKCHSLQFDANNPDLLLPHGNPEFVRAFLRSLPAQYSDFARAKRSLSANADVDAFVRQQMTSIRDQNLSGENLEQQVFFSDAKLGPIGRANEQGRARFPGCVYCHEVKPVVNAVPQVTPPILTDRWLIRGGFDHSRHVTMDCAKCHDAQRSTLTSDVLLPSKLSCAECHSPRGGVASSCSTCHSYHSIGGTLTLNAGRSPAQIVADIGLIEELVPKRGERQSDPHAAAIVALGRDAGPFLVEKITDDRDSKHFDFFQWRICDIADELLGDIYHQSPAEVLIARKPPVEPSQGYYYRDYVELLSSSEGRNELQAAWRKIVAEYSGQPPRK